LDASSSGEGGREIDLTVAGDVSDEGSAVMTECKAPRKILVVVDAVLSCLDVSSSRKRVWTWKLGARSVGHVNVCLGRRACEAHLVLLSSCRPTMDVPHVVHLGRERCFIGRAVESDVYLDS
ncbi:hypothetical protein FOZ63_017282, partial [Perkinsus olseni]